jgi:hypothetical protein
MEMECEAERRKKIKKITDTIRQKIWLKKGRENEKERLVKMENKKNIKKKTRTVRMKENGNGMWSRKKEEN